MVRLIVAGESNKDIARLLSISVPTVKSHVHNLLEKLGLQRRGKLALRLHGGATRRSYRPTDPISSDILCAGYRPPSRALSDAKAARRRRLRPG